MRRLAGNAKLIADGAEPATSSPRSPVPATVPSQDRQLGLCPIGDYRHTSSGLWELAKHQAKQTLR